MRYKYALISFSLFILTFSTAYAGSFNQNWERTYPLTGFDEGRSITSANNSVFVAGISLDPETYRLIKYSESGRLMWDNEIEAHIWNRSLRNAAISPCNGGIVLACTNGTFHIVKYDYDGKLQWQKEWGKANSVTDIATDGEDFFISGIAEGESEQQSHILKCSSDGKVEWNATLDGKIMGICTCNNSIFAAGYSGNESKLFKIDSSGKTIWSRVYGSGRIKDVAAGGYIYLLLSLNDTISLVKCDMNGNALWSVEYGERSEGRSIFLKNELVFIAGSVYNESSKDFDYAVIEYSGNGELIGKVEYNGRMEDEAWDVYVDGGIFATGYSVIKKIVDMNAVLMDRDIYTASYELPNIPPVADFSWSPEEPEAGKEVKFTDLSYDIDGNISSWKWSFGDGKISGSEEPVHEYKKGGTYVVNLTVYDDGGGVGYAEKKIVVKEKDSAPGFEFAILIAAFLLIISKKIRLNF